MLRLDENHNGGSVDLVVGETFELSLAENPTTGYRWQVDPAPPPVLGVASLSTRVADWPGERGRSYGQAACSPSGCQATSSTSPSTIAVRRPSADPRPCEVRDTLWGERYRGRGYSPAGIIKRKSKNIPKYSKILPLRWANMHFSAKVIKDISQNPKGYE